MGSRRQAKIMAALLRNVSLFHFLSLFSYILTGAPNVFEDYFNDDVKDVTISENIALKTCLDYPDKLIRKINQAKMHCFGGDSEFNWNDFADYNEGPDPDSNGMSTKMERAEMCFYEELGWTDGNKVFRSVIFEDFDSIPGSWAAGIKNVFRTDVEECQAWDGEFGGGRQRRSIEEVLWNAETSFALLPLSRQRRQAKKGAKKATARKTGKGPSAKKSGKKGIVRGGKAKGGKGKGGKSKSGKSGKKGGKGGKNTKTNSSIDKGAYNSLWCVDLAVQKYLRTCVENSLTKGESWNINEE